MSTNDLQKFESVTGHSTSPTSATLANHSIQIQGVGSWERAIVGVIMAVVFTVASFAIAYGGFLLSYGFLQSE